MPLQNDNDDGKGYCQPLIPHASTCKNNYGGDMLDYDVTELQMNNGIACQQQCLHSCDELIFCNRLSCH